MSSIYLHIPEVLGSCTEQGHNAWIHIESFSFKAHRPVTMKVGHGHNRQSGQPNFGEMEIVKLADTSSTYLFTQALNGKVIPEVTIDVCPNSNNSQPYSQYTLSNVIVSHYEDSALSNNQKGSLEYITLHYTKIEKKFTSYDATHKAGSPMSASFDLATGTTG